MYAYVPTGLSLLCVWWCWLERGTSPPCCIVACCQCVQQCIVSTRECKWMQQCKLWRLLTHHNTKTYDVFSLLILF